MNSIELEQYSGEDEEQAEKDETNNPPENREESSDNTPAPTPSTAPDEEPETLQYPDNRPKTLEELLLTDRQMLYTLFTDPEQTIIKTLISTSKTSESTDATIPIEKLQALLLYNVDGGLKMQSNIKSILKKVSDRLHACGVVLEKKKNKKEYTLELKDHPDWGDIPELTTTTPEKIKEAMHALFLDHNFKFTPPKTIEARMRSYRPQRENQESTPLELPEETIYETRLLMLSLFLECCCTKENPQIPLLKADIQNAIRKAKKEIQKAKNEGTLPNYREIDMKLRETISKTLERAIKNTETKTFRHDYELDNTGLTETEKATVKAFLDNEETFSPPVEVRYVIKTSGKYNYPGQSKKIEFL